MGHLYPSEIECLAINMFVYYLCEHKKYVQLRAQRFSVIGCKNKFFSKNDSGIEDNAVFYIRFKNCQVVGINPLHRLLDVLSGLPLKAMKSKYSSCYLITRKSTNLNSPQMNGSFTISILFPSFKRFINLPNRSYSQQC